MSASIQRKVRSQGSKLTKRSRRPLGATSSLWLERLEERAMLAAPQSFESRGVGGGGALFAPSISPFDANDVYIASDMSQLFHTTNLGQTWDTVTHREIQGNAGAQVQFTNDPAFAIRWITRAC